LQTLANTAACQKGTRLRISYGENVGECYALCLRYVICFVQNNGVSPETVLTDCETGRVVC